MIWSSWLSGDSPGSNLGNAANDILGVEAVCGCVHLDSNNADAGIILGSIVLAVAKVS